MEIKTHTHARETLLGTPLRMVTGEAADVALTATSEMAVDEKGLIHGGFTFGLADYAAMLAVNHPFVRARVDVNVGDVKVFTGVFTCFILKDHVLG